MAKRKQRNSNAEKVTIDARSETTAFPHFWEHMYGSGRAILSLREGYRQDLRAVKAIGDVRYVRFHAIFHDEVGIYSEDPEGKPVYNFSYVDQIYDGLLEIGVRPFVELSFMPEKLAEKPIQHGFFYRPFIAAPKDWERWGDMIFRFAEHLVNRYGIDEVSQWYFEVWNEPNISFWAGEPQYESYVKLYEVSAAALKRVDSRLRVGGPSTAQAAWVDKLIAHCHEKNVALDFVSTHVYANDSSKDVFGTDEVIPRASMVARAMRKVYDQVKASPMPNLPIIWSEFNASFYNEREVTDSPFMGPWLANHIRQADGLATEMSLWTFSDVFEEGGVVRTPYYGGFGLIAAGNIPKAAFNAVKMLNSLGDQRLPVDSEFVLATKCSKRSKRSLAVAVWNYFEPYDPGSKKHIRLQFKGVKPRNKVRITVLDKNHGSSLTAWEQMGKPDFPTLEQQAILRESAKLPAPTIRRLDKKSRLEVELEPHSLLLIEIMKQRRKRKK